MSDFVVGTTADVVATLRAKSDTSDPCLALNMALGIALQGPAQNTLMAKIEGMSASDALNAIINSTVSLAFSLSCTVAIASTDSRTEFAQLLEEVGNSMKRCITAEWPPQVTQARAAYAQLLQSCPPEGGSA